MAFDPPREVYPTTTNTTSGQSGAIIPPLSDEIHLVANTTAASGAAPTLIVGIQWSHDGGSTWASADTATDQQFASVATTGARLKTFKVAGTLYRIVWTIGGGGPSFDFNVTEYTTL